MIPNYEKLENGVIRQVSVNKITYDYDYSNQYNSYGERGNYLAHLRLGVLLGVLQKTPGRILDVGYGNGSFMKAANQCIPYVAGCDLSSYPVPDGCIKVNSITDDKYDVITFFDSLEHFDDINIISKLNTEYVFISVPWCHYIDDKWFENWYHRRPDEHLWHFNDISLKAFFAEHGYECIYMSNFEDTIRKNTSVGNFSNILSAIFRKM
jgi:hypothetical protein